MRRAVSLVPVSVLLASSLSLFASAPARADAITDWDLIAVEATKGYDGAHGTKVALDSNLSTRIEAIAARAAFDAVNSIEHFSSRSFYYHANNAGSPGAAAAQAVHDVLLAQLPDPSLDATVDAQWSAVRGWVDAQLASTLATFAVDASNGGIVAGKAAAAAAALARKLDGAAPVVAYGALLSPSSNPGVGIWRQSNAGSAFIDPSTGAPTGFDAAGTVIQGRAGVDLNWRDVTPFALTTQQKSELVRAVPLSPAVGSPEYEAELAYVKRIGQASSSTRTADQTAQALYYKQDIEIVIHEAARVASLSRNLKLAQNAVLFALLGDALADARFAAFASKYELKFWRPITALNAESDGSVKNQYAAWHPLAATPAHPSNTAGHAATGAAGFEVLRAFFNSDQLLADGSAATLTSLPWLVGTNSGTGSVTTRSIATFSQAQLENGASRIYLGVHFGFDNLQGQLLGLSTADTILRSDSPAAAHVHARDSHASLARIAHTLWSQPELYGVFAKPTQAVRRLR
ncbi:MAG: hypothetical protein JWN48_6053 [Myxococcaceae bacterium]|nr:hypothetical protein [Myxococcaceae bacterium]